MNRLVFLPLAVLIACNTQPTGPSAPEAIELVSGGDQQGVAGYPLPQPVVVRVVDARGNPLPDIELSVVTTAQLAKVSAESWVTNADGEVSFTWRMGASVDGETVTVATSGVASANPMTISARGGSRPVRAIAGGLERYCVVTLDQRLGCWRALAAALFPPPPEQVPTLTFRPEGERYLDVAMGFPWDGPEPMASGCAIRASGSVACFRHDAGLQSLADIGGTHPPFVHVFANHEYNSRFFCALTAAGEAWCWGRNNGGQLGDGTTVASGQPVRLDTDVRFTQLVLGSTHACGLDTDGAAWCWGESYAGAIGTGVFGSQPVPAAVSTPTRFVTLSAVGGRATCGRTVVGTWWCWGNGFYGTLQEQTAVPRVANIPTCGRLATPDYVGLASDAAGNAAWWGDLYPTLDLYIAREPLAVQIPFPVTRFSPSVRDKAACIAADADGRWLCIDLLWLAFGDPSEEADWAGARPLVHGVP